MVMAWLAGFVQPVTSLNSTVCAPAGIPGSVAPLFSHATVPVRRHFAPASIAPWGLIVTVREPTCTTYVPLADVVPPFAIVTGADAGDVHPVTDLNSTV